MIVFDRLWETMKNKGFTTYTLREKYKFDSRKLRRLQNNQVVTTQTLSEICAILNCRLEDISEFVPEKPLENSYEELQTN